MRPALSVILPLIAAFTLLFSVNSAAAHRQIDQEAVSKATLIFTGEVTRLSSATMPVVPVSANTIVVRVNQVVGGRDAVVDYAGREITVLIKDPQNFRVGDSFLFYTTGWLVGESIAVQEISSRRIPLAAASGSLLKNIERAAQALETEALRRRISQADLIVEGKVVSTEPVEILPLAEAAAEGNERLPLVIEHNPNLKRAVIEVISVLEGGGATPPRTITVLYPTGQDVKWTDTPRLERGDAGLFILNRAERSETFRTILRLIRGRVEGAENDYFISDAESFQPGSELERTKSLLRTLKKNER
jgi:hypothetical protein